MAAAQSIQALSAPPVSGGPILAVGATDREATFVALVKGVGLRYLDLSKGAAPGRWSTAGKYQGAAQGRFGLHYQPGSDGEATVSFLESEGSWVCLTLPAVGQADSSAEATVVARTPLKGDVASVCRPTTTSSEVALLLNNGSLRFMDLASGKAVGKSLKLDAISEGERVCVAGLRDRRVVVVRQATDGQAECTVVELDQEQKKPVQMQSDALKGLLPRGPLLGAEATSKDQVLLCWGSADDKGTASFATADFGARTTPTATLLAAAPPAGIRAAWFCAAGHMIDASKVKKDTLSIAVKDARYGLPVATVDVPFAVKNEKLLTSSSGGACLFVGAGSAEIAALRLEVPAFSLAHVIGSAKVDVAQEGPLAAVREAALGKRKRDDQEVQDHFSAPKRAATEASLAREVSERKLIPTRELVDMVVRCELWAVARALLALPELSEDLATCLLAADAKFEHALLAPAVRRASTPKVLEAALSDHLPTALLPALLETLLEWMDATKEFTTATLDRAVQGLPTQTEIIHFLSALADACLPSLVRLEGDLLERVHEALIHAQKERVRTENLQALTRAGARFGSTRLARKEDPAVEAVLLDF